MASGLQASGHGKANSRVYFSLKGSRKTKFQLVKPGAQLSPVWLVLIKKICPQSYFWANFLAANHFVTLFLAAMQKVCPPPFLSGSYISISVWQLTTRALPSAVNTLYGHHALSVCIPSRIFFRTSQNGTSRIAETSLNLRTPNCDFYLINISTFK